MHEMGVGSQRVQTSIYKISHGNIMYSMEPVVNTLTYLQAAKRVNLLSFHHKKSYETG